MPRLHRRSLMCFKSENSNGTYNTPAATDAVPFTKGDFEADIATVDRGIVRQFFGASDQLPGRQIAKCSVEIELSASGTAGVAPPWGKFLKAMGFAEALYSGSYARAEYTPTSSDAVALSGAIYSDGMLQTAAGIVGTGSLDMTVGKIGQISMAMQGIYISESVAMLANSGFPDWKAPYVIARANVYDFATGCQYQNGLLLGGSQFPSRGMTIDLGGDVQYLEMSSGDYCAVTNRKITGKVTLDLTPAQEVTFMNWIKNATTVPIGFKIGRFPVSTGAGYVTSGASTLGATTVTLATGTGIVRLGDIVTFAGHSTQYTVTASTTGPGAINFSPGLTVAVGTGVAVTVAQGQGVAGGTGIVVHSPAVQFTNPTVVNVQGVRMLTFDLTFQPVSNTGNDELRICVL
jgi:hypothetical protein